MSTNQCTERLFSYGTLRLESVQRATFGRRLAGEDDALPGFVLATLRIEDADVLAKSGAAVHPIVRYTGREADAVDGTVFEITADELRHADAYEVAAYRRVAVTLRSGRRAWAYVDARHAPPATHGHDGRRGARAAGPADTAPLPLHGEATMTVLESIQNIIDPVFPGLMGVRLIEVGRERVVAELTVRPDLCTTASTLHGGAIMAFADTLGAIGTVVNLPDGRRTATTDSSTKFISPAPVNTTVVGECVALHRGRTTMVWQTSVRTADGRLCAIVTQTQLVLND